MAIEAPYYPIVYVRGYAARMSDIEETVATPYMGFNLGATKLRQDYDGRIQRFVFESPLIRLMKDEGYQDAYQHGDFIPPDHPAPVRSVWIFRYYEPVSEDLGSGERCSIEQFALELRRFILRVRDQTCGGDPQARRDFKVHLVAHSMGGLICRCYLQNICRHGAASAMHGRPQTEIAAADALHELAALPADPLVDKVFTYATPHNGIELGGVNVPDLGIFDRLQIANFNRDAMRRYLALQNHSERVDSLDGAFPTDRFFCLVGTNYRDYATFFKLSRAATGPMSDGLVMMRNATVDGAPRAFVHRSHSGDYGIVNSEEGYQNLRRFLFGDVRCDVRLQVDEITLPRAIEDRVGTDHDRVRAAYDIETSATMRTLIVYLTQRCTAQESAIRRKYEALVHEGKTVYLFSGYLLRAAKAPNARDTALAFLVEVKVKVPVFEIDGRPHFADHFEGGDLLSETVTFFLRRDANGMRVNYGLQSQVGPGNARKRLPGIDADAQGTPLAGTATGDGHRLFEVPLGFAENASNKPRPGIRCRLQVLASAWS